MRNSIAHTEIIFYISVTYGLDESNYVATINCDEIVKDIF